MTTIKLKKILSNRETQRIVSDFMGMVNAPTAIEDRNGDILVGERNGGIRFPIELEDETAGWVIGDDKAALVVSLIESFGAKERERHALAQETLERYKELSLIYNFIGKIALCLNLQEVTKLVIEETRRNLPSASASVMLLNPLTRNLEIKAASGKEYSPKTTMKPGVGAGSGIAGSVFFSGKPEVVNDVTTDRRFLKGANRVGSLMCAPLKTRDKVIGVINVSSEKAIGYTAANLRLLNMLAAQAAFVIENAVFHENKLKEERVKSNLERYVAPQVVKAIMDSKANVVFTPEKRRITVLFSDIRSFTSTCEHQAPEKIVEYLNEYFTHMVDEIFKHGGTLNKFVGDMIVALFGAPAQLPDAEKRAIEAAIGMQQRLKTVPLAWIRNNFHTGIGINTGDVVVGNIGSPHHMDYTAIGDEMNIGSRLQSLAKSGQVLVSRSVYDATKDSFTFKEMGSVQVKGKDKSVEVFEVVYS